MKNFVRPLFLLGIVLGLTMVACMKQETRIPASDNYSPEVIKLIKSKKN